MKHLFFLMAGMACTALLSSCGQSSMKAYFNKPDPNKEFTVTEEEFKEYFESLPEVEKIETGSPFLELTPNPDGGYTGQFFCDGFGPCKKCRIITSPQPDTKGHSSIVVVDCICIHDPTRPGCKPAIGNPSTPVTAINKGCKLLVKTNPFRFTCDNECCGGKCKTVRLLTKVDQQLRWRIACNCVDNRQCPDLVVESVQRPEWDAANNRSVIKAVIKNIGNAPAAATLARVIDPSTKQATGAPYNDVANTPALAAGNSVTVTFYLPYWVYNPDAELEVTADYKSTLQECIETNNLRNL
ncbi:MAG: CARDB domain-containing protein [Bacteroidota bacterium]